MKKIFYIFLLITPLLFISSCEEEEEGSDIQIGASYQGGIIFYIDETGEHGLVVSTSDLGGTYQWGCYGEYQLGGDFVNVVGASIEDIGGGLQNTINIVNEGCLLTEVSHEVVEGSFNTITIYSDYEGQTAAGAAYEFESEGYTDWYLPSKYELIEIFNALGNLWSQCEIVNGGFSNSIYWSSTEGASHCAEAVGYCYGVWNDMEGKYLNYKVLPIRSF